MAGKVRQRVYDSEIDHSNFRDIPETGGRYRISRTGEIISRAHPKQGRKWWGLIRGYKRKVKGRYTNHVRIFYEGCEKPVTKPPGRLILEAWVGPPPSDLHWAAHKNGDPLDDRLENLAWAIPEHVVGAQTVRGSRDEQNLERRSLPIEQVLAIREIREIYGVNTELLAAAVGVSVTNIRGMLSENWGESKWRGRADPLAEIRPANEATGIGK